VDFGGGPLVCKNSFDSKDIFLVKFDACGEHLLGVLAPDLLEELAVLVIDERVVPHQLDPVRARVGELAFEPHFGCRLLHELHPVRDGLEAPVRSRRHSPEW
jgi:hypothetical protein